MASLYELGWRQGTIVEAQIPLGAVILDPESGEPRHRESLHGVWVIATQDCDLNNSDADHGEPCIELRPVYTDEPPPNWGIRSAKLRLTERDYVVSASPRPVVSPAVLTALADGGATRREMEAGRRTAFTTWLGLRYDRPAVPNGLMPLARRIAEVVDARRRRAVGERARDVLMEFDDSTEPPRFSLIAVLDDPADEDAVRVWLADIAQAVPAQLGVADRIEAAPATLISLHLIENSYAADVTQLTWHPNDPEPKGAH